MIRKTNKYCCEGFKAALNREKNKGISVVKAHDTFTRKEEFCIQYRAIDVDKKEEFRSTLLESLKGQKVPSISLQGSIKINFCPWCGKKL